MDSDTGSSCSSCSQESGDDDNEPTGPHCDCKTTCQRRGKCPCKTAGVFCGENCTCGTIRKPCKNKQLSVEIVAGITTISNRGTRIQALQDFVTELTSEECHKLVLHAYSNVGGLQLIKAILQQPPQGQDPQAVGSWCVCTKCRNMGNPTENVCCHQLPCITLTETFDSVVLDRNVLSVAILSRSDLFVDDPEYTPASYRKAAYRQFTMWFHGYLGRGNRRVIPSCVIWKVRDLYPAPDGNYLGFKEY